MPNLFRLASDRRYPRVLQHLCSGFNKALVNFCTGHVSIIKEIVETLVHSSWMIAEACYAMIGKPHLEQVH